MPLYLLKTEHFSWTAEAQEALNKLKAALTNAPILTSPMQGEPLYLYVAATTQVFSAVARGYMLCQPKGHCFLSVRFYRKPR